jgi:hypothetical protein
VPIIHEYITVVKHYFKIQAKQIPFSQSTSPASGTPVCRHSCPPSVSVNISAAKELLIFEEGCLNSGNPIAETLRIPNHAYVAPRSQVHCTE